MASVGPSILLPTSSRTINSSKFDSTPLSTCRAISSLRCQSLHAVSMSARVNTIAATTSPLSQLSQAARPSSSKRHNRPARQQSALKGILDRVLKALASILVGNTALISSKPFRMSSKSWGMAVAVPRHRTLNKSASDPPIRGAACGPWRPALPVLADGRNTGD